MLKESNLSVVLATYNEEKNIQKCLESVKGWCKEIIVVDGSSRDKTVEIARRFGATVVIAGNPQNFHINKQKAINLAHYEWILQLDADEYVTRELKAEIDQAIQNKAVNGYQLPRKNFFLGRFLMKGGVYPDYTFRLYKRGKGKLPQKDVHEQAVVEGETAYLRNPLIHLADPSFSRYWLRFNRYTDFLAKDLQKTTPHFSALKAFQYILIKPIYWFGLTYIRHLGFLDSWQGFVFSFFSSLRFPIAYFKYITKTYARSDY